MISLQEARDIIDKLNYNSKTETVELQSILGRSLCEDVCSDVNIPPFDKSAMDGYACKAEDLPGTLNIVEEIAAGYEPKHEILGQQCARISTGAKIPLGANCVVMQEDADIVGTNQIKIHKPASKTNICVLAEDVKANEMVLASGTLVKPHHVAHAGGCGAHYRNGLPTAKNNGGQHGQ
ncbi:MAG: hypothetical protein HC896_03950 [Bacteroidales bacterium]|nr:hypothetical protein [Bacteroidales bacterium]